MDDDKQIRITLRLPRDIHDQLGAEAEISNRSLNGEIVARLSSTIAEPSLTLPKSLHDAISARAHNASTSFQEEMVRALAAGLDRKAPAVLLVELTDRISLGRVGKLLDEARERLPADTAVWISPKKTK